MSNLDDALAKAGVRVAVRGRKFKLKGPDDPNGEVEYLDEGRVLSDEVSPQLRGLLEEFARQAAGEMQDKEAT